MSLLDEEFAERAKERQQQQVAREAQSRILIGGVMGFVLASVIAVGVGFFGYRNLQPQQLITSDMLENAKQEQYYRGLYDTCVGVLIAMRSYPEDVAKVECYTDLSGPEGPIAAEWYEAESPGFTWPIP